MHLLTAVLLLLILGSAEPWRVPGSKATERGTRGRVRGKGRTGVMRRQTQECKEYMEAGEKYLDCQDTQLTFVRQDWPKDIQHLLLARNKIQILRDNMFEQFTQLKSLDLQQNVISVIEDDAFSGLSQLTTLLLQHNRIRSASEEVLLPLPHLTYLRIFDNPWSCRCPLDSLVRTLQVPSNRNLGNYARCAEPRSLKGQKLKKLTADLLCAEDNRPEEPQPGRPIVRTDAVSICHLKYPRLLLDCSHKGERKSGCPFVCDTVGTHDKKNRTHTGAIDKILCSRTDPSQQNWAQ
ncbi:leucine-rich repeat-containing protein 17-like isoform X1 [Poecilia latipinna]|nr:PREDICTED: leucine-rich repeat-containing protein 17-like isoform X1 [Poecilia latipinna]XP_014878749.1 PREDICTED: leucine-rich repeat-containing protein 17-like isoform X1 [Poecilia latipinna]XP_014878750.1 PREDICTED: leucine-rich repeat-containing protein 17-like isoform X1 [Poecilia latipinna]